jgi:hypothetical protein
VFGSLIFSFLTITLRANQNVTGLALTIFGTGFGNFLGNMCAWRLVGVDRCCRNKGFVSEESVSRIYE